MLKTPLIAGAALASISAIAVAQPHRPAEVIGIPKALAIVEQIGKRQILEAELDYEKGRLVYEVKAADPKGVHELRIDAVSGDIVSERPLRVDSMWRQLRAPDTLNAVRAGRQPLSLVLSRLEADRKTRVQDVGLERERGQTYYEVDLADGGRKVLIDPRTGAMRDGEYDD